MVSKVVADAHENIQARAPGEPEGNKFPGDGYFLRMVNSLTLTLTLTQLSFSKNVLEILNVDIMLSTSFAKER